MKRSLQLLLGCVSLISFAFTAQARVILPKGGEEWTVGSSVQLEWESVSETVTIRLIRLKQEPIVIVEDVVDTGSYLWLIPEIEEARTYRIEITPSGGDTIQSRTFRIMDWDAKQYLGDFDENDRSRVTHPLEAAVLDKDNPKVTISWVDYRHFLRDNVRIYLHRVGRLRELGTQTHLHNTGSYDWQLDERSIEACRKGLCYFVVRSGRKHNLLITSHNFTLGDVGGGDDIEITKAAVRLNEISDDSGSVLTLGWTGPEGETRIDLYNEGHYHKTIKQELFSPDEEQKYHLSWPIPATLPGGDDYTVVLTSLADAAKPVESEPFSIEATEGRVGVTPLRDITLTKATKSVRLRWTKTKTKAPVDIDLYRDGRRVKTIARNLVNKNAHIWKVPRSLISSEAYTIRVAEVGGGAEDAMSYGWSDSFAIASQSVGAETSLQIPKQDNCEALGLTDSCNTTRLEAAQVKVMAEEESGNYAQSSKAPDLDDLCTRQGPFYVFKNQIVQLDQQRLSILDKDGVVYFCKGTSFFSGLVIAKDLSLIGHGDPEDIDVRPLAQYGFHIWDVPVDSELRNHRGCTGASPSIFCDGYERLFPDYDLSFEINDYKANPRILISNLTIARSEPIEDWEELEADFVLNRRNTQLDIKNVSFEDHRRRIIEVTGIDSEVTLTNSGFFRNDRNLLENAYFKNISIVNTVINENQEGRVILVGCSDSANRSVEERCDSRNGISKVTIDKIVVRENQKAWLVVLGSHLEINKLEAAKNGILGNPDSGFEITYVGNRQMDFSLTNSKIGSNVNAVLKLSAGRGSIQELEYNNNANLSLPENISIDTELFIIRKAKFFENQIKGTLFSLHNGVLQMQDSKIFDNQFSEIRSVIGFRFLPYGALFASVLGSNRRSGDFLDPIRLTQLTFDFENSLIQHDDSKREFTLSGFSFIPPPNQGNNPPPVDMWQLSVDEQIKYLDEFLPHWNLYTFSNESLSARCDYDDNNYFKCTPCELTDGFDNNWDGHIDNYCEY